MALKISILIGLLLLARLAFAEALSDKAVCYADAEQARRACTTSDTTAGTTDNGAQMGALVQAVKASNAKVSAIGAQQGAQCANQADISKNLQTLSRLKAQACANALAKCTASCSGSTGFHTDLADLYSLIGDAQKATAEKKQFQMIDSLKSVCVGYKANVAQASTQTQTMLKNAGVSQSCLTSTTSSYIGTATTQTATASTSNAPLRPSTAASAAANQKIAAQTTPEIKGAVAGIRGTSEPIKISAAALASRKSNEIDPSSTNLSALAISNGVTGALGPSLWEKVSRRYQLRSDLLTTR